MNIYRNKKTGVMLEIPSEFGCSEVWELVKPTPSAPKKVKAEPVEDVKAESPKKPTARKAVKK